MRNIKYPRIYLVLDNCFAIKRWTKPGDWMGVCKELGYSYVQPSTDNELDPLFHSSAYLDDWFLEVDQLQRELNMHTANFYTSYQTYRTTGFADPDRRIGDHLEDQWFKEVIPRMKKLGAKGIGFHVWAMTHPIMQNKVLYQQAQDSVMDYLSDLNRFANEGSPFQISIEQMYDPHLPPFTIDQTRKYLTQVTKRSGIPLYVTIDVGHAVGQRKFLRPTMEHLYAAIESDNTQLWLGTDHAYNLFEQALNTADAGDRESLLRQVFMEIEEHDYLFSNPQDTEIYHWVEQLGCYSPIYHLQQTNGISSNHAAFTKEANKEGIIKGDQLLKAIKKSYDTQPPLGQVQDIYLSFEIFAGNMETERSVLEKLRESTAYWRQFIPRDGMYLDELID